MLDVLAFGDLLKDCGRNIGNLRTASGRVSNR